MVTSWHLKLRHIPPPPPPQNPHHIHELYIMRFVFHHNQTSIFWTQKSVSPEVGRMLETTQFHIALYGGTCQERRAGISQSVQRLATGWAVRGSNPIVGEIFSTCPDRFWGPDRLWGPPRLLYKGYRVFTAGKAAGTWRWPLTSSTAEVKERVELYIYSTSGFSWPVNGWTLPYFRLTCHGSTVEPVYNDIGLYDTSPIVSGILCSQLITFL